jgi:hypothetical protein
MQYRSPFSILYLTGNFPDSWDDTGLLRVQKQLLLELEHHGGGMLQIGEEVWTKDDILKLIDALRPAEEHMFHQWIYENPALLLLLEQGIVSEEGPLYNPVLVGNPGFESFQAFVSPYLVESVGRGMSQSFAQQDFATVRQFLEATTLLVPARAEEILARLMHVLKPLSHAPGRVTTGEEPFNSQQFGYITPDFIVLLNALPESIADFREWFAIELMNMLVKIGITDIGFSHGVYKCLLALHCEPDVREVLVANYTSFQEETPELAVGKVYSDLGVGCALTVARVLGVVIGLCILVYGLMKLFDVDPPTPDTRLNVLRRAEEEIPTARGTYRAYRNRLRAIVQKQLTPSGADSMRYILLTDPQVNNEHTLWHHAVPGTHLSNYKPTAAQSLTIVNRSQYDAVLFVMGDSALYNRFLSQGDSVQTSIRVADELAFYVGNDWASPGSMKRGVHPWTDVKAQYGIFTQVDSTTLLLLDKAYHLPASKGKKLLRVSLTTTAGGLQLIPNTVLLEEISQKSP